MGSTPKLTPTCLKSLNKATAYSKLAFLALSRLPFSSRRVICPESPASKTKVSESTVVRFAARIGYKGYTGFVPLKYLNISASERKRRVTEIMKRMAISHRAQHFPQQLSGGQQQRVAIARAVVAGPKLILADEPTGNLDSKNGREVMNLLRELNDDGTTIVMVTHSQKDAAMAQRTIDLFDGRIVSDVKNEL